MGSGALGWLQLVKWLTLHLSSGLSLRILAPRVGAYLTKTNTRDVGGQYWSMRGISKQTAMSEKDC